LKTRFIHLHAAENGDIIDTMDTGLTDPDAARRQLERVLASPGFVRNERMSRFLRFLTGRHLEGNDDQLKESVIAVEVFGRRADHNPSQDSIVRTEASRLRARLAEYYVSEGAADAVVIELPKGGYTPTFRNREPEREAIPATKKRRRLWPLAAGAGLLAALAVLLWWRAQHQTTPVQIAVLPLENLDHNTASDYFADGLTDELIRNLSLIEGLAPRSRTSSFVFKGKPRNVRSAGKELGADYIVEGSVLLISQRLRVEAQLVRVRDDFPLWSGRYDRAVTDVFAIQDEISRNIVNSLRLKLGRGRRRYETSTEAYDLYLRARALGIQQGLSGEVQSVAGFEDAIAKDPSFAPAYAGLAAALVARSGTKKVDSADELDRMQNSAEKALSLDPLLAEAYGSLGMVYARKAQWQQSERSFRRASELDPNDSVIYGDFALSLLFPLGRIQEAIQQLRIAVRNDPLAPRPRYILANALMAAGRFDEAAAYCLNLPSDFPGRNEWLGRARLGQGRIQEAIHLFEKDFSGDIDYESSTTLGFLGYAYGRAGRRKEAENLAARTSEPYDQALIFVGIGDKERALGALERMAMLGPVRLGRDLNYPEFEVVRSDPRVKALREKIGLPELR
jgi:adenylate cyclase